MTAAQKGFQLVRRGELGYLQSPLLEQSGMVDHAFSTRLGGCSEGAMASLNTAFHTGDHYRLVLENRRRLLEPWGYSYCDLVAGVQVHGSAIAVVTEADRGRGAAPGTFLTECDALVTDVPGVLLTAYAADCMLLFFTSPDRGVAALAHAGWRGTLEGIAGAVVKYLRERFAVNPARLLAALSPAICARCYRIDEALASRFHAAGWDGAPYLEGSPQGGYNLDLSRINRAQLLRAGIKEPHLAENSWCTACRPDLFYSYRRESGDTGRMMGFIALKPFASVFPPAGKDADN